MTIEALYCDVDDFNQDFYPVWEKTLLESGEKKRRRQGQMSPSEIMTIIIHFHQSHYRSFKHYYLGHVHLYLRGEFPKLLSYTRFLEVMANVLVPLCSYLTHCQGKPTGIAFIDSTPIGVCHNKRILQHSVFKESAERGRSSMGWFYGFKVHLVINHQGEILSVKLSKGNVDDREYVPELVQGLTGKLYGDKGYISKALTNQLEKQGLELKTNVRKNMKPQEMTMWDRLMLTKRFVIETVNDQLKNISQIEHTRHRSTHGFMLNLVGGLIAYCHKKDKPSTRIDERDLKILATI